MSIKYQNPTASYLQLLQVHFSFSVCDFFDDDDDDDLVISEVPMKDQR